MEITWDDLKEAENVKKHGIEFDEAVTVIQNPLSLFKPNKHKSGNGLSIWDTLIEVECSMS